MEHSAIHLTCIKLPSVLKSFVLSIFEWTIKAGFPVYPNRCYNEVCYKENALYLYLQYCSKYVCNSDSVHCMLSVTTVTFTSFQVTSLNLSRGMCVQGKK